MGFRWVKAGAQRGLHVHFGICKAVRSAAQSFCRPKTGAEPQQITPWF